MLLSQICRKKNESGEVAFPQKRSLSTLFFVKKFKLFKIQFLALILSYRNILNIIILEI